MTVSEIIDLFIYSPGIGSMSELARLIPAPVTTVSSWKEWNHIPGWRKARLLELAAQYGVSLSATDFPLPEQRRVKAA